VKIPSILWLVTACAISSLVVTTGCDRPYAGTGEKPVTEVKDPPPKRTPFEEGSARGFTEGEKAAKEKHTLPSRDELIALADKVAPATAADRGKWQEGFAEGFTAGHRKVAEGAL
jgi:hypothetical protein